MNPIVQARQVTYKDRTWTNHYYWCPGCNALHGIAIAPDKQENGASWSFTGTLECPTYAPSQLTKWKRGDTEFCCHTFIRNGQIEFLGDCTHELKGKTVPMVPLPDWFVRETNDGTDNEAD